MKIILMMIENEFILSMNVCNFNKYKINIIQDFYYAHIYNIICLYVYIYIYMS